MSVTGDPVCGPGAHFPGADGHGGYGGGGRRPGPVPADGSRHPVPVGSFPNQLKHWGISPSFAFIEQPQTNGVAERFIRTIKEQVIYGRVFQNLQEVREAVRRFVDTYNRE